MAHHSDKPFDGPRKHLEEMKNMAEQGQSAPKFHGLEPEKSTEERQRALTRALLDTTGFVGALGQHSQGKLTPSDEGDIQFRVGCENGKVVLDFGTPVHWVGMDPQQAADLASSLLKWARIEGRKNGITIALNLSANQS